MSELSINLSEILRDEEGEVLELLPGKALTVGCVLSESVKRLVPGTHRLPDGKPLDLAAISLAGRVLAALKRAEKADGVYKCGGAALGLLQAAVLNNPRQFILLPMLRVGELLLDGAKHQAELGAEEPTE